jgi:hypothetical protein
MEHKQTSFSVGPSRPCRDRLAGRIQEAYETIKKVLFATTFTHELWLRHPDRICCTLGVLYVLTSCQSEPFVILQSRLR